LLRLVSPCGIRIDMCFMLSKVDGIIVAINPLDCRNYTLLNITKRRTFVMHQHIYL
jgi:hypothetical protein